jgi:anti-anti-sigma factor
MHADVSPMIDEGQFRLDQRLGVPLVEVRGDLDISNADQFEAMLDRVMPGPGSVVVSLAHATYFDSRGIHSLLRFADRLSRNDGQLLVVAPSGTSPRRILDIARVQQLIPMFESVEEAIASLPPTHQ